MFTRQFSALQCRTDVFFIDNDHKLFKCSGISVLSALLIGFFLCFYYQPQTTMKKSLVPWEPNSYITLQPFAHAKITLPAEQYAKETHQKQSSQNAGVVLRQRAGIAIGNVSNYGSGDINVRVRNKGVLKLLYGKGAISAIAGERTVSCPTVKDIDAALQQIVGLKLDGLPKFGCPGLPTHKFNIGYNGIGGSGPAGIDDYIQELSSKSPANLRSLTISQQTGILNTAQDPAFIPSDAGLAGRSAKEIHKVVLSHISGLRAEYMLRLRVNPNLAGKITTRFTITSAGNVQSCIILENTMNDKMLELAIARRIKNWLFDPCASCGSAIVVYPFCFSQ